VAACLLYQLLPRNVAVWWFQRRDVDGIMCQPTLGVDMVTWRWRLNVVAGRWHSVEPLFERGGERGGFVRLRFVGDVSDVVADVDVWR